MYIAVYVYTYHSACAQWHSLVGSVQVAPLPDIVMHVSVQNIELVCAK